jgi:hypothetical protein
MVNFRTLHRQFYILSDEIYMPRLSKYFESISNILELFVSSSSGITLYLNATLNLFKI